MTPVSVSIHVIDELGDVSAATVSLTGPGEHRSQKTDGAGVAIFRVPRGSYELRTEASLHDSDTRQVEVVGDATVEVDLGRALLPIVGGPDGRSRDDWLNAYGTIDAAAIAAANALWQRDAPRHFAGLLAGSGYGWSDADQTYASPSGSTLTDEKLYWLSLAFLASVEHDVEAEATRMASGETSLSAWQQSLAGTVRSVYLIEGALASGGMDKLPQYADTVRGDPDETPGLLFALGRLWDFADAIAGNLPGANTLSIITDRSGLYIENAHSIGEAVRRESHRDATDKTGRLLFLYERSILEPGAEHCVSGDGVEGCIEVADHGWAAIGELTPVGLRRCGPKCKCRMRYSLTGPAEEN